MYVWRNSRPVHCKAPSCSVHVYAETNANYLQISNVELHTSHCLQVLPNYLYVDRLVYACLVLILPSISMDRCMSSPTSLIEVEPHDLACTPSLYSGSFAFLLRCIDSRLSQDNPELRPVNRELRRSVRVHCCCTCKGPTRSQELPPKYTDTLSGRG
jgi:hypothetical protein